eukprot:CAMPEP_0204906700 /NCGR_PEP_ID=MMETSP1397-20131031/6112_1 /ASSEMBLY_ACC=CAM_ASM_000891 /TAXON_ID=49980 /ORGANISM="Climacostomum Climacostomum virens, Strain Stock W-24" /LENGTH=73 /DNA_ID=CAMNT_0052075703 /DNA_START=926 /DNA_END=1147 /DNA_ORIENTATION=-
MTDAVANQVSRKNEFLAIAPEAEILRVLSQSLVVMWKSPAEMPFKKMLQALSTDKGGPWICLINCGLKTLPSL